MSSFVFLSIEFVPIAGTLQRGLIGAGGVSSRTNDSFVLLARVALKFSWIFGYRIGRITSIRNHALLNESKYTLLAEENGVYSGRLCHYVQCLINIATHDKRQDFPLTTLHSSP